MNYRRLLIVDDDELNAKTLSDIFEVNRYQVDTALSGAQALKKAQENTYGCILSDIRMPNMNGIELLTAVKAIQPATPFILMTAYTDDDLIMEGIKAGALITLIKPLDINRLLAHVARFMPRSV